MSASRVVLSIVLPLLLAGCRSGAGAGSIPDAASSTAVQGSAVGRGAEILWDSYGVPHIYAKTLPAIGYAFGWAQAQNHGDLLLRVYGQARGRAAEYWGGTQNVAEDRWVHTVGGVELGQKAYDALSTEYRAYLDAFAAGINDYARANGGQIVDSVEQVLPVSGADVMSHSARVLYSFFLSGRQRAQGLSTQWSERGSNAWAIAPSRSASGKAMLLQNPHLPWSDVFTWMEAHLVGGGADVYGAALVGSPVINIGFNERLGWTHTVNTTDTEDYYELTLQGSGYMFDGGIRPFERSTRTIKVKRADGSFSTDTLVVKRSVHGPIVRERSGKALALRIAGLDRINGIEQWWAMGRARNLAEFERALSMLQITGQNTTYADADGHILYFYGNVPARPRGDVATWAGVVRGDSSSTLWADMMPYASVPRVLDPPSGFVQNANDPPWFATYPVTLDPSKYPAHVAPRGLPLRPQRSLRMVMGDSSISYDELIAYKHSTRLELADRVLDDLLSALRENRDPCAASATSLRCESLRALSSWDRNTDATSRGAVLFTTWWDVYVRAVGARGPYRVSWSEREPLDGPRGLSNAAIARTALDTAATRIKSRWNDVAVAWGDVYRLQRDNVDIPANGAGGNYGAFRVVSYGAPVEGKHVAAGGDSYVGVIEFSRPTRARTLIGYGNASQPGSPNRTNQLQLFADKQLREVWRTRAEIERHLASRQRFQ